MLISMFRYARVGNLLELSMFITYLLVPSYAGNFFQDVSIDVSIHEGGHVRIQNGGQVLSLTLDWNSSSVSWFESKSQFLLGRFDMQIKLIQGESSGTITSFYLSSSDGDGIYYLFYGNSSGEPYTMRTDINTQGVGNRIQEFRLWFDPTLAFHTYTIIWNAKNILFMVDNTPVRVFTNNESKGIPFPSRQAMRVFGSLLDGEDLLPEEIDWSKAPYTVYYSNYTENGCVLGNSCNGNQAWKSQTLDANGRDKLQWVQKNYMIYNYCTDVDRSLRLGFSRECKYQLF